MKILRDIPEFEGLYCISRDGEIWSYPNRIHTGLWLKPAIRKGYYFVCLCKGSIIKKSSVHRMVAITYLDNPNNYPQINHIDGNKLNNRVDNLEWCTASHNKKHSWDIGTSIVTEAKRAASRANAYKMLKSRGINHV